jgi:hypothetical protein
MSKRSSGCLGVISLIVSVVSLVIALLATTSGKSAESYILDSATPTCSDPNWLVQVPDDQISVSAFYYYQSDTPDHTINGDPNTAWLQWWPTADFGGNRPTDNYIEWDFSPLMYNLRLICVADGFNSNIVAYDSTEPIRKATIYLGGNDCPIYGKTFSNNGFMGGFPAEWQPVKVLCRASLVRLVVDSTYSAVTPLCEPSPLGAGTTECRPLTGISQVKFYYSPDWLSSISWSAPTKQ